MRSVALTEASADTAQLLHCRMVCGTGLLTQSKHNRALAITLDEADLLMDTPYQCIHHTHRKNLTGFSPITSYYLFQVMAEMGKFLFHAIPLGIFNIEFL